MINELLLNGYYYCSISNNLLFLNIFTSTAYLTWYTSIVIITLLCVLVGSLLDVFFYIFCALAPTGLTAVVSAHKNKELNPIKELNPTTIKLLATGWTFRRSNPGGSEIYY
jgi:hypothetical protein